MHFYAKETVSFQFQFKAKYSTVAVLICYRKVQEVTAENTKEIVSKTNVDELS